MRYSVSLPPAYAPFRFVCARRPLLPSHLPAQSPGNGIPTICRLSRSKGSNVIGRVRDTDARAGPLIAATQGRGSERGRGPCGLSGRSAQSPEPPARGSPRDLAIGIDASEINGPVWFVSDRGTAGAFRSRRADRGAQVLPPAGATVPPWLPAKSARVSNLPACCALGPPASAAQYSCRREPCTGRSAWLPLGRACRSAWIEHRSGEQRSP
jgi:hypothetical protein